MLGIRQFALALVALFFLPSVLGAALQPRASNTPCTYSCPAKDDDGRTLRSSSTSGNVLRCNYSSNGDRNCRYNRTTGNLSQDNDDGDCMSRAAASGNCPLRRREARAVFDAYEENLKKRAEAPTPTVPDYMKVRSALKKRANQGAAR